MATSNSTTPQYFGPMSDTVNAVLGESRVYWCDKCQCLKTVPPDQFGCPGCGDLLDLENPFTCEFSDYRTGKTCTELATYTEEMTCHGAAPGSFSETHDEPRCGKH